MVVQKGSFATDKTYDMQSKSLSDKLIWLITLYWYSSFTIMNEYLWNKYVILLASVVIFLITIAKPQKTYLRFDAFQKFILIFSLYCLISSLWAINIGDSVSKAITLFEIFACYTLVYYHYIKQNNIMQLLRVVMWGGYIVSVYSILFYGLENLIKATETAGVRLDSEYNNVNTIGLVCAVSCLIQVYFAFYHKENIWSCVFIAPALAVVAATQSRKAFLFVIIGVVALLFFKAFSEKNKNAFIRLIKVLSGILICAVVVYLFWNLEIFKGVNMRVESMFNGIFETGKADASTLARRKMISLGIEYWKKYPIFGIGIGNSHIIVDQFMLGDAYMHNNFVELLSGGGIVGFSIYYAMYIYLFYNLIKFRNVDRNCFSICFVWLILMLVMDYGMVSYYSKSRWFYLMIQFINIECMRKKARRAVYGIN